MRRGTGPALGRRRRPARPGRRRPSQPAPGAPPPAGAGHPLVGAVAPDLPGRARASPRLNSYTGDGIALQTHPAGNDAQGAWAPTGERTAVMTLLLLGLERGATWGMGRVRAALEVDAAGDAFAGVVHAGVRRRQRRVVGRGRGRSGSRAGRIRAELPAAQATPPACRPLAGTIRSAGGHRIGAPAARAR